MKDNDYILATDIRAIDCAKHCLDEIVPENNPVIETAEYFSVMRSLTKWREAIYNKINEEVG